MLISIIIPVIRPHRLQTCLQTIYANAGIPKDLYEIITEEDKDKIGCPKMVKKLVSETKAKRVCFLADDTLPEKDFLMLALSEMEELPDKWGLVGLADGTNRNLPCHFLAHKKLLPLIGGEFFNTSYTHCYCDVELRDRAMELGQYVMSTKSRVKHLHPLLNHEIPTDEHYERVYSKHIVEMDKALYEKRKANKWV